MTSRDERVAANEALFRDVNERVADIMAELGDVAGSLEVFCECGDHDCMEKLTVERFMYEKVRENATQFLVLPGHEVPEVEMVVDERERLLVVQKVGEAASVARITDPRG